MFLPVITALAFIITFIVVGLVVVAAAFSGGRRNRERPPGPTRRCVKWGAQPWGKPPDRPTSRHAVS